MVAQNFVCRRLVAGDALPFFGDFIPIAAPMKQKRSPARCPSIGPALLCCPQLGYQNRNHFGKRAGDAGPTICRAVFVRGLLNLFDSFVGHVFTTVH